MGSEKQWLRDVSVCAVHGDSSWYVCYETKTHRLRLTHRGTWSMDDMDIYYPTKGGAYHALHFAPCPLEDPYSRIAALEAALAVLAAEVVGNAKDRAVGKHWDAEIDDAVWDNPIAAEAVREAGR